MGKVVRSASHQRDLGPLENGSPHPQGAPRGLLHFYALLSIARKPMRGYDLIKEIETKTEGAWRPGPGAVYPVLRKLVNQGYITAQKETKGGSSHVLYEMTPAGLESIANAKKMMKSSTERWNLMTQLFIDLMEPDDLVRFVLNSLELQIELVHTLVESDRSGLSDEDKLFILHQYRLNLERELTRAIASIKEIDGRTPSENASAGGAASKVRKA
ncbi:MAG: PadR family transcriptional regulator [Nitrososphaerales archaeon]